MVPRHCRGAIGVSRLALMLAAFSVACSGELRPQSIVLVVVDTVRADHLGTYGYTRLTSPELDRWAEQSALFTQAHANSPWTLTSFGTLYTGRLPSQHSAGRRIQDGPHPAWGELEASLPTLAELLFERGFTTAAIVNNPFLERRFGVARGFEHYDEGPTSNLRSRRADEVVDLALEWLDRREEGPFLLVIHLFDPHAGYDAPEEVRGTFTTGYDGKLEFPVAADGRIRLGLDELDESDQRFVMAAYDEELLYVDRHLGRLFAGLESRDLFEQALVVLTSDHGEEFWDHQRFEHGHTVYEEQLHVPLLFWGNRSCWDYC